MARSDGRIRGGKNRKQTRLDKTKLDISWEASRQIWNIAEAVQFIKTSTQQCKTINLMRHLQFHYVSFP
jgi:hypothetical protein